MTEGVVWAVHTRYLWPRRYSFGEFHCQGLQFHWAVVLFSWMKTSAGIVDGSHFTLLFLGQDCFKSFVVGVHLQNKGKAKISIRQDKWGHQGFEVLKTSLWAVQASYRATLPQQFFFLVRSATSWWSGAATLTNRTTSLKTQEIILILILSLALATPLLQPPSWDQSLLQQLTPHNQDTVLGNGKTGTSQVLLWAFLVSLFRSLQSTQSCRLLSFFYELGRWERHTGCHSLITVLSSNWQMRALTSS